MLKGKSKEVFWQVQLPRCTAATTAVTTAVMAGARSRLDLAIQLGNIILWFCKHVKYMTKRVMEAVLASFCQFDTS